MLDRDKQHQLMTRYKNLYHEKDGSERTPDPEEIEAYEEFEKQILKGEK